MTLGEFGSTLNDELNRLANGGTYRDKVDMVDEALAAKQWANRENINPYSTDTVGILNEIAGLGLDKKNWLDFNGVCNYIAGTTGLPAAAALRQVYPTTDLLTGVASYYVDATAPTNWGSLGYVRLNGVSGNYLSTPDSTALDITGDIDVRVRVAMDDWTPSGNVVLISKFATTGNQRTFRMLLLSTGILRFNVSTNGTSEISADSTIAPTVADGSPLWVRATRVAATGVVQFFTSTDGTTWTQLGTDVSATSGNIFASTAQVEIGSNDGGFSQITGNFYRAQVLNGIGGTTVLDVNIATDYRSSNQSFFTATTGQTVTVNGVDTIANLGTAGSLLPTTLGSSTAADSNDPKFLDHTGTNYVYLPGTSSNALIVADEAALDITSDLDLRVQVAMDDWTPGATSILLSKRDGASTQYSWTFYVTTAGLLALSWSADGSAEVRAAVSSVAPTITDGSTLWVRTTLDVDNGASGNDVIFYTSTDGTTWTQLGTTRTAAGTTSIYAGTASVRIGVQYNSIASGNAAGKFYRAQILDGIDGTTVLDVDTSVITSGAATSFTAVTGQTVTINRSTSGRKTVAVTQPTWLFGTDDYMEVNNRYMSSGTYLYLPGVSLNYASAPDSAALDITGDIDMRFKVALDDWTPTTNSAFAQKDANTTELSYRFVVLTTGLLRFSWSANGTTWNDISSTVAPTVTDGSTLWARATLDVDNGAGGNTVTFYTSTDGTNWTQLGSAVTTAGTTSIYSSNRPLILGASGTANANLMRGKFFRAQILDGIDGTVAFDANFESSITSLNQASFTESSANAATVTINRSGSAYRSAGITEAGYLYPGATNTFTASATDFLNFGASDSFTVLAVTRQWSSSIATNGLVSKGSTSATPPGYTLYKYAGGPSAYFQIADGTVNPTATTVAQTAGAILLSAGVRDISSDNLIAYAGSTAGTAVTDTTTASLANFTQFFIGRTSTGGYLDGELVAAAVFRQALTANQIRQISNYFANREVYL